MKNLDNYLNKAKKDSNSFFTKVPYEKLNRTVLRKISNNDVNTLPARHFGLKLRPISIFAVSLVVIAVISIFTFTNRFKDQSSVSIGEPVSQEMIEFDNSEKSQWLYYFKFRKPDHANNNLLAVIWEYGRSGNYEIVYSSVFENSNKPCKSSVISFPDDQPPIFVISSLNDDEEYIHYRMLGFKENKIFTLMEQNYVSNGKLEVIEGVLKETRFIPTADNEITEIITYFIPYQLNEDGDIVSSAEKLRINRGEHIALVGYENMPVALMNNTLIWEKESDIMDIMDINKNIVLYSADKAGKEYIYICPLNNGQPKKILVEIVDK